MKETINRFDITSEVMDNRSFIMLNINDNENLAIDDLNMLKNNQNNKFLQMDTLNRDKVFSITYDITSKVPLLKILEKKISKYQFQSIMMSIIEGIELCSNFLLNEENILLDENAIFVDVKTYKAMLIYVPVEDNVYSGIDFTFSNLLKIIIDEYLTLDDKEYFVETRNLLRNKGLKIGEFAAFFKEGINNSVESNNSTKLEKHIEVKNIDSEKKIVERDKSNASENYAEKEINTSAKKDKDIVENSEKLSEEMKYKANSDEGKTLKLKKLGKIIGLSIILIGIALVGLIITTPSLEDELLKYLLGTSIFIGVSLIVLYREIDGKCKVYSGVNSKNSGNVKNEEVIKRSYKIKNKKKALAPEDKKRENEHIEKIKKTVERKEIISDNYILQSDENGTQVLREYIDSTVMLSEIGSKIMILVSNNSSQYPNIILNDSKITIGRQGSAHIDVGIDSNAISKVHAELILENDVCMVIDINSKNGTFVNGKRIKNQQQYKVNDGDKIKFADVEYLFTAQ